MDRSTFIASIRGWTGYKNPDRVSDTLIDSWIRNGEERINMTLRIADMIQIDTANVLQNRVSPPNDWIANDYLRFVNGGELFYKSLAEFYRDGQPTNHYTTSGRFLILGGNIDQNEGEDVELHYFGNVPQLTGAATWLSTKYLTLLTAATMIPASMHLKEPDAVQIWALDLTTNINALNETYQRRSPQSGALIQKKRGFHATRSSR